jgi:CheY-like chemotaxis protein/HPt (histidine-containing phosphotransfer) domain-containing protein
MAPYGLSIETVLSGFEAVEKVRSGVTYDVIFMDHFMPGMDGIEATKIIRGLGYTQPIIALTANALAGQAEMFLEHGFDGYISKPIDIRQLNAALNKLIRDRYPSETIDAARRLKNSLKKYSSDNTPPPAVNAQLAEIFARDAGKAAAALEAFCARQGAYEDEDLQNYTITVHSMKSALANIGETELSDFARNLEHAGRERNIAVLSGETPIFLNLLRALIEKIRPKDDSGDEAADADTDEARAFLNEKLLDIQVACDENNKRAAKDALIELREKTWPRRVRDLLSTIDGHLLHSEFEEVSHVVADYVSSKGSNNA